MTNLCSKNLIFLGILFVIPSGVRCACSSANQVEWCGYNNTQILGTATQSLSKTGMISVSQCQSECLNLPGCWSFDYSPSETTCQFHNATLSTPGIVIDSTTGVSHYYYVCGNSTACPETIPTAEPENSPEPEGESEVTPEEFWQWIRDEPVWFALIGMAVLILLLFIIIVVLICALKNKKSPEEAVYEQAKPTTLDRTFVYMRESSTESVTKEKEALDDTQSENRRSKLTIDVP